MSIDATAAAIEVRATSQTPATAIRRALRHDLFGVRGLTLHRFGWTALFVALFTLSSVLGNAVAAGGFHPPSATLANLLGHFVPLYAVWFVPAMIAATIADNLPLRGIARVTALGIALMLAASLYIPYLVYFDECVADCETATLGWYAFRAFDVFMLTSAIAVACFARRRDQEIAAALHAAENARLDAERAQLQSKLQTMQARVEPTFLLDALRDVGALCERDRKAGGRMLDLLIQYLRAALPRMRETDSTLEREVGLLRSYLGILALRSNGMLTVACRFDEVLVHARMPAMVLVPMVASVAGSLSSAGAVKVDAIAIDRRVRITLTAHGVVANVMASSTAVADVGDRVRAIYGASASLAVERGDGGSRLILEFPYESSDSRHR